MQLRLPTREWGTPFKTESHCHRKARSGNYTTRSIDSLYRK